MPRDQNKEMHIRSNGKLMISGEYLVLAGAKALAMPVKYGQSLHLKSTPHHETQLHWSSLVKGKKWLEVLFRGQLLEISQETELNRESITHAERLREILLAAKQVNNSFLSDKLAWQAVSNIEFDLEWGLGSSSTLVSNIASWAQADPFEMLFQVSGGSGYDIACARSDTPLIYTYKGKEHTPEIQAFAFNPNFAKGLYFVFSGKKQRSEESLKKFDARKTDKNDVAAISKITEQMLVADNLSEFMLLLEAHEKIVSKYTGMLPVKESHFTDFPGTIKSLGAWGGDFLLAASEAPENDVFNYFEEKGLNTVIPFGKMRLNR